MMSFIAQPTVGQLKIRRAKPSILASAVALGVAASPAAAQQASEPPAQLPTISVEGQRISNPATDYKVDQSASPKFTAPLLDTPKSVTVITQSLIEERGSSSLTEVLRTVPGVTLGAGEGGIAYGDRPFIRGFDSQSDIFIDGQRDQGSQFRDPFNLEQVEIVKGAGSAYSGRGSTGGSINLVSKTPKAENAYGGSLTLGTDMTKRVTTDLNQVVADGVALRLNAMYQDSEVAGRDAVEMEKWGFAPSVTFGLNKPTQLTLSYYHFEADGIPDYGHPFDPRTGKPVNVSRDNFYGILGRDFQEMEADSATALFTHEFNDSLQLRNQLRLSRSKNDYVVTVPGYPDGNDYSQVRRNVRQRDSVNTYLSNMTDLLSEFETGSLKHSLITGVEVTREQSKTTGREFNNAATGAYGQTIQQAYTNAPPADLHNPNPHDPYTGAYRSTTTTKTTADTIGVYAFDTIELSEQFEVNGGVRWDSYEVENNATPKLTSDGSELSWQAGVVYKPAPNGSVYASYGSSFNPSTEGLSINTNTANLDPEKNATYELGTKWDLFNRRLSLTGAVFRTEKTNARVADLGGNTTILDGESRVDGIELGFSGSVTPQWKVFGGYTLMRSKIVDDGPNAANDGNEMPNVPRHSFSLWTTYDLTRDWTIGGGAFYMSERYANQANDRELPDYWRFDAMAGYKVTENVSLQLNVINLLDETYYDSAHTSGGFAYVAPGRTALLTTNVKF
jgi:catecholate siderophore receptor